MMSKISKASFLAFGLTGFTSIVVLSGVNVPSTIAATPKAPATSSTTSAPTMSGLKQSPLTKTPVLKIGSQGQAVKELQTLLKAAGVYRGTADGAFGQQTQSAVIKFQQSKQLKIDGVVGAQTWAALHK